MVHVGVVWANIKSRSERGCQRAFPILRSIGKAWLWFCTLLTVWDFLCFGDLQLTGTVIVIFPRWIGSLHSNVIPPNFTVEAESRGNLQTSQITKPLSPVSQNNPKASNQSHHLNLQDAGHRTQGTGRTHKMMTESVPARRPRTLGNATWWPGMTKCS